jgi:hypothetical protein
MVAAGDEGGARRRAQRRGVEIRVAQPICRDPIQSRRRDDPPKVEGALKPTSSVMIKRMFGASFGGTTRAGQAAFDCRRSG